MSILHLQKAIVDTYEKQSAVPDSELLSTYTLIEVNPEFAEEDNDKDCCVYAMHHMKVFDGKVNMISKTKASFNNKLNTNEEEVCKLQLFSIIYSMRAIHILNFFFFIFFTGSAKSS